jgi:hypothetical protein
MNLQMFAKRRLVAADEQEARDLVDIAFSHDPNEIAKRTQKVAGRALAIGTREIDARVLVQQGAFTVHTDGADLADVGYSYSNGVDLGPWRRAFKIPAWKKNDIRELLALFGVRHSSVYPDLGALAAELKSRIFF